MKTSSPLLKAPRPACGFTLIELLVVLSIATILFGLLVPALGALKSSALNQAGNTVVGLVNLARETATSKNTATALVLLTDSTLGDHYRVFGIFELGAAPAGGTSGWQQISKWEQLEAGTAVDAAGSWTGNNASAISTALSSVAYRGETKNSSSFQSLIFLPNGSLLTGNNQQIKVVEGIYPSGAATPRYTHPNDSGSPANYYLITVLASTGRTRIERP